MLKKAPKPKRIRYYGECSLFTGDPPHDTAPQSYLS